MRIIRHRPAAPYPGGAKFAFTILDDTDDATVENVKPVYDLLHELGLRTTKTAWPLDCPEGSNLYFAAQTLHDSDYLAFIQEIIAHGFEVASHGATMESSPRERTERGLRFLREALDVVPKIHCNHGQNRENIYWGAARYRTLLFRLPLVIAERVLGRPRYEGHVPGSPFFWGDLCLENFRFVRNFTFSTLNSGAIFPGGPYKLASTGWVNYWFNTSDAPDAARFKRMLTPASIDDLRDEGGVCILSTHLGKGFTRNGRVDPQIEERLRYVAAQPGWFATVSDVLEHLLSQRSASSISVWERWMLEARHLADRITVRFLFH